jgi:uncharacterized membrane-anchored protein YhcB (DUF1043 family)
VILALSEQEIAVGLEIWIVVLVVASGLSGWAGYVYASRRAPKRAELETLEAELDEARREAETVRADVSSHFEQSAALFGKLAGDYREFLEHFADSAGKLGLSEARARALIEEGVRPLLTHEVVNGIEETEAGPEVSEDTSDAEAAPPRVADVELNVPQDVPVEDSEAGEQDERSDAEGTAPESETRRRAGSTS